jgi:hypothetical protein
MWVAQLTHRTHRQQIGHAVLSFRSRLSLLVGAAARPHALHQLGRLRELSKLHVLEHLLG